MMRPFQSLRVRLTVFSALVSTLLWAAFSAWLYLNLQHGLMKEVNNSIWSAAEQISALLAVHGQTIRYHDISEALEAGGSPAATKLVQIVDDKGRIIDTSENLEDDPLPINLIVLEQARQNGVEWNELSFEGERLRMVSVPVRGATSEQRVVQVAMPLTEILETLSQTRWILVLGIPMALLLSCLAGWWLAGKALQPVAQITERARHISAHDLGLKLEIRSQDELGALAGTLNEMFARLDVAFTKLEDAYRQIQRFSADASHELRTPLTTLRGEAEVALRQSRTAGEYRETLEHILREAERMSKIVDDLLLLAQADSGEVAPEKEPVQLDLLLSEVVSSFIPIAKEKGAQLRPSGLPPIQVIGDESYLFRLFANLIDNGVKYTSSGGTVSITVQTTGHKIQVTVSDTGIGIAPEHLPYLFERFYRVDKARSRQMGGSGLGLSIAQWIAEAHGGRIEVKSEVCKGSSFTVVLPIASQD